MEKSKKMITSFGYPRKNRTNKAGFLRLLLYPLFSFPTIYQFLTTNLLYFLTTIDSMKFIPLHH